MEEKDISLTPGAYARIKELTTARTVAIRQMRRDVYQVPNTTHWIQTSNRQAACPVASGDTRITVIQVGDLLTDQQIQKQVLEEHLREEAPHFMYTLLNLTLPSCNNRLRLPMVATVGKANFVRQNAPVASFVREMCEVKPLLQVGQALLHKKYAEWADANGFRAFDATMFKAELLQVTENRVFDNKKRAAVGKTRSLIFQNIALKEVTP